MHDSVIARGDIAADSINSALTVSPTRARPLLGGISCPAYTSCVVPNWAHLIAWKYMFSLALAAKLT